MTDDMRAALAKSRRALQNPYAHIEELETLTSSSAEIEPGDASPDAIRASRRLMEDPYAHVDEVGYSASARKERRVEGDTFTTGNTVPTKSPREVQRPPSLKPDVADEVRRIHRLIWEHRNEIAGAVGGSDPIRLLDPEIALHLLGFKTEFVPELGTYRRGTTVIEVAGAIDRRSRLVRLSLKPTAYARRFTLAHELGHAVMHPQLSGLHRDRASDGSALARDGSELEADVFASLFLMPEKLVRSYFRGRFRSERFAFTQEAIIALGGEAVCATPGDLSLRAASRLLAGAGRFDGRQFLSLREEFQVSRETMAIRIEELDLIDVGR